MKTVCKKEMCVGCMACVDVCPKNAIKVVDNIKNYDAIIDENLCVNCDMCHKVCQNIVEVKKSTPQYWFQGWVKNEELRKLSSSGGVASAMMLKMIEEGGFVVSCSFENGEFIYTIAHEKGEIRKFVGSKYVKSNPQGIYKKIKQLLVEKNKVLFIGLPCHVAALRKFTEGIDEELITVDLICHGTPSPKIMDEFLKQYGTDRNNYSSIQFRNKAKFQLKCDNKGIITHGVTDKYLIGFLNGLFYTENCYHCQYACLDRCSDVTLGDSWGTELPIEEQKKGISFILCQNKKGLEAINNSSVCLLDVDLEKAICHNSQLKEPTKLLNGRNIFFEGIKKGKKFNRLVFGIFPKKCFRQDIKQILIKLRLFKI